MSDRPRRGGVYSISHPHPCQSCWLKCVPRKSGRGYQYPCSDELRVWAHAHQHDEGDEEGYVWEESPTS